VTVKRLSILLAVLLVAATGAAVARGLEFRGAAKPGVHVLGADVGGESGAQIGRELRRWSVKAVTIRADGHSYHVPRGWLVSIDVDRTVARTLAAGSELSLVVPSRVDVAPVVGRAGHANNVLDALAKAGQDPVSASVAVDGTNVVVRQAREGRRLDDNELVRRLSRKVSVVDAPFTRVRPAISDRSAQLAARKARALLAQPVAIVYHGAHRGALRSRTS
jgi:hypothetical protein